MNLIGPKSEYIRQSEAMSKHNKHETVEGSQEGTKPVQAGAEGCADGCAESLDAARQSAQACQERLAHDTVAMAEKDARIAELEGEAASLKDQYLRKLADYENFRKRMFREKEDSVQYANAQILTDLAAVLDDFERAIKSAELSKDFKTLHDGVDMIRKNLVSTLQSKYGLAKIETAGAVFDPNVHEALMSHPGDCDEPTVSEELQAGYRLRDRVLRPAKVKVMMPGGQPSGSQGADGAVSQ